MIVDTFKASLDPSVFRLYRRYLYSRYKQTDELSQGEVVHEKAKEKLASMAPMFREHSSLFDGGPELAVRIGGHLLASPVGLAAGFDKNCDLLLPTSHVFGFVTPGSVLLKPRAGNPQSPKSGGTTRLAIDDERQAIINAQGYPHKGLVYSVENLRTFATDINRGKAKVLLNFSGITENYAEDAVLDACKEIISRTSPYVDLGFEENRTSPNTDFNKVLQSAEFTRKITDLMNSHVPSGLLKVSKVSPYSSLEPGTAEMEEKIKSIKVFYENGGDAVTIGNTRPIPTSSNKKSRTFSRPVAGESGRPLFPYMLRLVRDVHEKFPELPIIACGGIFDAQDAWKAIEAGASCVELYTALTFNGFGAVREIQDGIKRKLAGKTLQEFLDIRK